MRNKTGWRNRVCRRAPSLPAAYVLFGAFMLLESKLRQGTDAQSTESGAADRGTTCLLGVGSGAGLLSLPIATALRPDGRVPELTGPLLMVSAIALRAWAARTLGRFYTRTLRTMQDQAVVRSGPYQFVRHPGYLGTLLMWLGFGLSSGDWLVGLAYGGAMRILYARRIRAEEAMLVRAFGDEYLEYMRSTPGLVPDLTVLVRPRRGRPPRIGPC